MLGWLSLLYQAMGPDAIVKRDYATFQLSTLCLTSWNALIFWMSVWVRPHGKNPLSIGKSKLYIVVVMIGEIFFQGPSQPNKDIWTLHTWARQRGRVYLFLQKLPLQLTAVIILLLENIKALWFICSFAYTAFVPVTSGLARIFPCRSQRLIYWIC